MVSLPSFKTPMVGLLLAVSYSSMVLDIIMIVKVHENQFTQTYPPAVVAMLVGAILHVIWCLGYLMKSGKSVAFQPKNIIPALAFFFLWQIVSAAITAAFKSHYNYCPTSASNYANCHGDIKGTQGLGFALAGLDLVYAGYLAALVSKYGKWDSEMFNIPERKAPNADMEKAAAH